MDTSHYLSDAQRATLREQAHGYGLAQGWIGGLLEHWEDYYVNVCEQGQRTLDHVARSFRMVRGIGEYAIK